MLAESNHQINTLGIGDRKMDWLLAGSIIEGGAPRRGQNIAASAYVNGEFLADLTGQSGLTNSILLKTVEKDDASLDL